MMLFSAEAVLASSTTKFGIDCSNEATNYSCREYSCGSNGGYDLHPQEHPIFGKVLRLDCFQSFNDGILDLV